MKDGILVINAGSSSVKFSLFVRHRGQDPDLVSVGQVEGINAHPHFIVKSPEGEVLTEKKWADGEIGREGLFRHLLDWVESHLGDAELVAAGHRVVHGGSHHTKPAVITPDLISELRDLIPLAPLHQPHNISPIEELAKLHPGLKQIACFDTAFHRTNPWVTQTFAIPYSLTEEGVRRYGFHGLSYQYIARRLAQVDPALARGRVVALHIGSGASLCAMKDGKSYASTMGFTALDGLVMGTRSGTLDAGVLLYLMDHKHMTSKDIETLLYKQSGLLGVSGISSDMRDLIGNEEPRAKQAVELFIHRICRELGSLTAAMEGLDGLVFTAGVGEHSPYVRQEVCARLQWLGVKLDANANSTNDSTLVSTLDSKVQVLVIPTNEELMIALAVDEVLKG
jgi:acetate kinase